MSENSFDLVQIRVNISLEIKEGCKLNVTNVAILKYGQHPRADTLHTDDDVKRVCAWMLAVFHIATFIDVNCYTKNVNQTGESSGVSTVHCVSAPGWRPCFIMRHL